MLGPLDMKGLLGAATVMGSLMYGVGHVWEGHDKLFFCMSTLLSVLLPMGHLHKCLLPTAV